MQGEKEACVHKCRGALPAKARVYGLAGWMFLLLSCASSALPQQQPPEDLKQLPIEDLVNVKIETVYGASKFIEKVGDAPASVTIGDFM
jgi:hypothetical protein